MQKLMISLSVALAIFLGSIALYCRHRCPQAAKETLHLADLNQLMIEYAALGTPDDLQILVQRGASVEAKEAGERTAFMIAIAAQNLKNAQWLLDHGADINATAYNHSTSLMLAIEDQRIEAVHFLISHGIDLNRQDEMGNTALMRAIICREDLLAQELIKAKADMECKDVTGHTALSLAIQNSNRTITQSLLDAGANLDVITTPEWKTPLFFHAVMQDDIEILKMVLATGRAPLNAVNISQENALNHCLMMEIRGSGNSKIPFARLLIDAGINVNQQMSDGLSPLMLAVACENTDLVEELLNHGAVVDLKDQDGNTALSYCDAKKHPRMYQLLKKKKSVNFFKKL